MGTNDTLGKSRRPDISSSGADKNRPDDFTAVYNRYGVQLDKEDELVNSRVKWLLGTQTILFAAIEVSTGNPDAAVLQAVRIIGFVSSVAIGFSILAAILSFLKYRIKLLEKYESVKSGLSRIDYPQLNRRLCVLLIGDIAAIALPVIFAFGWFLVK